MSVKKLAILFLIALPMWGYFAIRSAPPTTGAAVAAESSRTVQANRMPSEEKTPLRGERRTFPSQAPTAEKIVAPTKAVEEALSALRQGDGARAREVLEKALRDDPNNAVLTAELGMVYARAMNEPDEALRKFNRALQLDPNQDAALHALVQLASSGDEKIAGASARLLEQVARENPEASAAHRAVADHFYRSGHPERVESLLGDLVRSQESRPDGARISPRALDQLRIDHIYAAARAGDVEGAVERLVPLVAKYPEDKALKALANDLSAPPQTERKD